MAVPFYNTTERIALGYTVVQPAQVNVSLFVARKAKPSAGIWQAGG